MKQTILISGASGMLATGLASQLEQQYSVKFLTRKVRKNNEFLWDLNKGYVDSKAFQNVNYIIHLAGASIATKRWTKERKQVILSSRVASANLLLEELKRQQITIDGFISASAVGYYGSITTNDAIFTEESPNGTDFLSDVCLQWEKAAHLFTAEKVAKHVSIVRIGVILSKKGGALEKIVKPIRFGFGAALGTGKQFMPWIHIQDLCGIFKYILDNNQLNGIFNAVAPEYVTNKELTNTIAATLDKKIWLPNVPSFLLKLALGKMSTLLLEGSRVSSEKIINAGYNFKFTKLSIALNDLLK